MARSGNCEFCGAPGAPEIYQGDCWVFACNQTCLSCYWDRQNSTLSLEEWIESPSENFDRVSVPSSVFRPSPPPGLTRREEVFWWARYNNSGRPVPAPVSRPRVAFLSLVNTEK